MAGPGAVDGLTVTVHGALDAYHQYRKETEIDPDTGKPREAITTERNNIALVKRLMPADMRLTALSFAELHRWCKAISARPLSKETNQPIRRATVRNCLKTIRQWIRWASRNYGWKKPEDWHEATEVMVRRTANERHEAIASVSRNYTVEELATLWRYALPSERMLILLGLNFGFVYSEIHNVTAKMLDATEMAAIRGKSGTVGKWQIWPETRELARTEFDAIPAKRQDVANRWNRLLDRITKDVPTFRRLSYKWLRKTGTSFVRRLADGEIASLYLSHGEQATTDDELLEIYSSAKWDDLDKALSGFHDQLAPMFNQTTTDTRTYLPLSKIERIRQLWAAGARPAEIMKETGASHATVYRYRPAPQPA